MTNNVLITDIQKFAVNDGPGFRTNVFLKGCPLHCTWCHNPETISYSPELYWKKNLCVQCGQCLEVCEKDAINPPIDPQDAQSEDSSYYKIQHEKCDYCMKCTQVCDYDALTIVGNPMSIDDVLDEVQKDRPFYDNSGGGMTVSGGEPTSHHEYTINLLRNAQKIGIHTCLDTNGFCPKDIFQDIVKHADVVLFDLKHIDSRIHKQKTGVGNELILENLISLVSTQQSIWVRIPIIPNFNDSIAFHQKASDLLADLHGTIERVDLLPFHNYCQDKYGWLGIDWTMKNIDAMDNLFVERFIGIYRKKGLPCNVGGSGFETNQ